MSGLTWTKFFWADWESDPALRLCSYAAQGLWMRMLCIASAHDPIGYVAVAGRALDPTAIARMTGGSEGEVQILLGELDRNGVFSRDRSGRIYSRRMIRDARKAAEARKNGKLGGNPKLRNDEGNPAKVNPADNDHDKPQKPNATVPEEVVVVVGASPLDVHGRAPLDDDWPRTDLTAWRNELARISGPGLADHTKHGGLTTSMGEIHRWRVAGCSWELDVLPVVSGKTTRPSSDPIHSWTLFTKPVLAARDRRLAALPPPDPTATPLSTGHGQRPINAKLAARHDNLTGSFAGSEDAAELWRRTQRG